MPHASGPRITPNCHNHTLRAQTTSNWHHQTRGVPITSNCHGHTLRQPIIPDCHNHTRGHKPHPTGATNLAGTNLIQLSCHTLRDQTHPTATATHAWHQAHPTGTTQTRGHQSCPIATTNFMGIKHIQLPSLPHTRAPTTSNWHHEIREYQSHPIAMRHTLRTTNQTGLPQPHIAGTNHIQLAQPTSWVPILSNCHGHTLRASNTSNCHSHTRGHQPHPTGTTKLVATNHHPIATAKYIGYQSHPTAIIVTHVGTKHIQLSSPYTCAPTKSNRYCPHA